MANTVKPLIFLGVIPGYDHLMPIRAIAKEIIARGHEVKMVTASDFRNIIEEVDASFVS